ncbi:hypothetical protein DF047_33290 [Burkholderia cenocepacia]|nr:hypothetical protein DF047_33290 [Burkholderia cenocepacia]
MTAALSPFSRALEARIQYAYAVRTSDPGSPAWFNYLHTARQHAIALARACASDHDGECPPLIADIPMLRDAFEGAVLEIHQRQRRQIDGDVAERNPLCSRNLGGGQEQRAPGPARAQA